MPEVNYSPDPRLLAPQWFSSRQFDRDFLGGLRVRYKSQGFAGLAMVSGFNRNKVAVRLGNSSAGSSIFAGDGGMTSTGPGLVIPVVGTLMIYTSAEIWVHTGAGGNVKVEEFFKP